MFIIKEISNCDIGKLKEFDLEKISYIGADIVPDLIYKNSKLVYRSIGETSKDLIYKAIKSSI